jgi:hypothetical protein
MVSRGTDVDFRQFWMEKWTGVPFLFFFIPKVLPIIKIKTQRAKNKVCKPRGASRYLTFFFSFYLFCILRVFIFKLFVNIFFNIDNKILTNKTNKLNYLINILNLQVNLNSSSTTEPNNEK